MGFSLKNIIKGAGKLLGGAAKTVFDTATGGIGSAVGSLAGDALSGIFGKSSSDDFQKQLDANMAYQKQMLDYTNQKNLEQSKELSLFNNEQSKEMSKYMYDNYQSPAAQVQAYKAAGLNPYMLSNSGSFSPTASSSVVGGSSPVSSGSSFQRYQYDASLGSTIAYQEEQRKYTEALARGVQLDSEKKLAELPYVAQTAEEQLYSYIYGNRSVLENINLIKANVDSARQNIENMKTLNELERTRIGNLLVERSFVAASIEEKYEMIRKIKQDVKVGEVTWLLLQSQRDYTDALKKLTDKQYEQLEKIITGIEDQQGIAKAQRQMAEFNANVPDWVKYTQLIFQTIGSLFGASVNLIPGK